MNGAGVLVLACAKMRRMEELLRELITEIRGLRDDLAVYFYANHVEDDDPEIWRTSISDNQGQVSRVFVGKLTRVLHLGGIKRRFGDELRNSTNLETARSEARQEAIR